MYTTNNVLRFIQQSKKDAVPERFMDPSNPISGVYPNIVYGPSRHGTCKKQIPSILEKLGPSIPIESGPLQKTKPPSPLQQMQDWSRKHKSNGINSKVIL